MELKFNKFFSESNSTSKNDFEVKIDTIASYYKANSIPPVIQIRIGENNTANFLERRYNDPKIYFYEGLTYITPLIEKIKNKII